MDVVELVTTQPVDVLNLNENQLTSLPEEIGLMTGLKTLIWWNQLTSLPEEIGLMTGLKKLYLVGTS